MKLAKDTKDIVTGLACAYGGVFAIAALINFLTGDASPNGVWAFIATAAVIGGAVALLHRLSNPKRKP